MERKLSFVRYNFQPVNICSLPLGKWTNVKEYNIQWIYGLAYYLSSEPIRFLEFGKEP